MSNKDTKLDELNEFRKSYEFLTYGEGVERDMNFKLLTIVVKGIYDDFIEKSCINAFLIQNKLDRGVLTHILSCSDEEFAYFLAGLTGLFELIEMFGTDGIKGKGMIYDMIDITTLIIEDLTKLTQNDSIFRVKKVDKLLSFDVKVPKNNVLKKYKLYLDGWKDIIGEESADFKVRFLNRLKSMNSMIGKEPGEDKTVKENETMAVLKEVCKFVEMIEEIKLKLKDMHCLTSLFVDLFI